MLEHAVLTSATSCGATRAPCPGHKGESATPRGYGQPRTREAEIQRKRISFQLIWETRGLIRVPLDNLGQSLCLSGPRGSSLQNGADAPLPSEAPGDLRELAPCHHQGFQRPGSSGTVG